MLWYLQRDINALVHGGDDFVSSERKVGTRVAVQEPEEEVQKKFVTKMVMVGEDDALAKEARVLNRIVRWYLRKRLTYEADPRHAEKSVLKQEQKNSRPSQHQIEPRRKLTFRETKEEKTQDVNERRLSGKLGCKLDHDDGDTLSSDEVTRYRRIDTSWHKTTDRIRHE